MIRDLFEREVSYLWSRLTRAARGRDPALAALWSKDGDPRVTRVVQAAAYAFARVKEKLEDDLPEISHALVASALPEALRPMPSATIVKVESARGRAAVLDVGSLESRPVQDVPCTFRTCWPVAVSGVQLSGGAIRTREHGVQTLSLRLEIQGGDARRWRLPADLRVFTETTDPVHALDVVRAVTSPRTVTHLRAFDARGRELAVRDTPSVACRWTALDGGAPLLPGSADRFPSGTLLRSFFAFPELFAFFDVTGFGVIADLPPAARILEIAITFHEHVSEAAMDARFHLGCTPSVNVFEATTVPLPIRTLGPCGTFALPGPAGREIVDLVDAGIAPDTGPDTLVPVRVWETHRGHAYLDDELYLRIERRAAVGRGPTEMCASLLRPYGDGGAPRGALHARVLATDGYLTESLLPGDLGVSTDALTIRNLTRVTPFRAMPLGERLPWRVNAYARMPVARFADAASLAGYLDVHDVTGARRASAHHSDPASAGVTAARRRLAKRVEGDEVFLGDDIDLALDARVFGGAGATWLVGEILARALAERADFVRFTRTRLLDRSGEVAFDYGVRRGQRLPPPFG